MARGTKRIPFADEEPIGRTVEMASGDDSTASKHALEYLGKEISTQKGQPYKRIIIMHMTIIFGGFLVMLFETTLPALMLLVLIKIAADLRSHLREHASV